MKQSWRGAAVQAIGGFAALTVFSGMIIYSFQFILSVQPAQAEIWDGYNNPANMDVNNNFDYNIGRLPLEYSLPMPPWSETYWPTQKGSINYRWNSDDKSGYYSPPSKEEVEQMSQDELAALSPAEKYDIYMGRYDYPLHEEATWYSNPRAPNWHGICDGWSIAAVQYKEPAVTVAKNPDGIMVPFGSSDLKGLMSFAAAIHFKVETRQVGSKCEGGRNSPACLDINAGAMHVILANMLGIKHIPFVTERDPGPEIWNQPTYGYEFQLLGSAYSRDGDHGIQVHGTLYYTDELDQSRWDPVVGTPSFAHDKLEMDYILDMDENDNIIGGTWYRGSDHPDFMWYPTNHLTFTDYLSGINQLYHPAN